MKYQILLIYSTFYFHNKPLRLNIAAAFIVSEIVVKFQLLSKVTTISQLRTTRFVRPIVPPADTFGQLITCAMMRIFLRLLKKSFGDFL